MVDVNTQGVNDAYKRLAQAGLNEADAERKCTVNADDLNTVLMAFTFLKLDGAKKSEKKGGSDV